MRAPEDLLPLFRQTFQADPDCAAVAPGRVNLIGEHTDYNKGLVLPVAINLGVTVLARRRDDRTVRAVSVDYDAEVQADLARPIPKLNKEQPWSNYVLGTVACVAEFAQRELPGMDLLVAGDVPIGGGLSSSAALEVATANAVAELAKIEIHPREMALLCQSAEHEYAGVKCGIMDQFVATHGQLGCALLLDCRDLGYALIPIHTPGVAFLVIHSGVSHGLQNSEYNARRAQCEAGVAFMAEHLPFRVQSLRDVTIDHLLALHEKMDPVVVMRCRHVITENERVRAFAEALSAGDAERCGRLLLAGHMSLRQDYEVSCPEVDALVELAEATHGVFGARMVGAGFGGCVLVLVDQLRAEAAEQAITVAYAERTGIRPSSFFVSSADGGRAYKLGAPAA